MGSSHSSGDSFAPPTPSPPPNLITPAGQTANFQPVFVDSIQGSGPQTGLSDSQLAMMDFFGHNPQATQAQVNAAGGLGPPPTVTPPAAGGGSTAPSPDDMRKMLAQMLNERDQMKAEAQRQVDLRQSHLA